MAETFVISEEVYEKVNSALNAAIALATRFEPSLMQKMLDAGMALDDAINGVTNDDKF